MLRMKRVNLQHPSYKHVFPKSNLVGNNLDPDQTAFTGPAALDPQCYQKGSSRLSMTRLKSYKTYGKSIVCPQNN